MTKSPFPLLDPIMLGPLLAYLNVYFGAPLPELFIVTVVAVRECGSLLVCQAAQVKPTNRVQL